MLQRACMALSCAFVLAGCVQPVALGVRCERSGECAAPLVCASSRCRNECLEHRDCPLGATCVVGHGALGTCTLDADSCATDADCGAGLVCRSGECWDACATSALCPIDGVCVAGLCQSPSGIDGGVDERDGAVLDAGMIDAAHIDAAVFDAAPPLDARAQLDGSVFGPVDYPPHEPCEPSAPTACGPGRDCITDDEAQPSCRT
ncbi:MAG: hypothetical protein M3Y87_32110, partial [Myxococcota bacterium]|nr:hypothetical protein [Myxococcota bacterium]